MSIFVQKWFNCTKTGVLAPKMLCKDAGGNDSGLLDIRNMTRMDSTKAAGRCGRLSAFEV
jgi:hypothetical protein